MTEEIYAYPATVRRVEVQERQIDLLAMAKANSAYDPAIFDERAPFFWTAEVSNNQIDSHFTQMLPATLRNFAADARAGVSFLNSHRHNELPFGRSLDARVEESADRQRVIVDFFTLPGLNLNGVTTDDFILGVRSGIVSDVSVGFWGGDWWCSLCSQNYRSFDCPHLAGMKFEVKDRGLVVCTVGIDDAHLSEVSGVYDGSTPDATIQKAQRMAADGELKPEAVRILEARYRMKFETKRSFPVVKPGKGTTMEFEQMINQIREVLALPTDGDVVSGVLALTTTPAKLELAERSLSESQARVKELEPQAADGRAYRDDLITEALAEGVRAYGDKFNKATYEGMLRSASIDIIKQMRSDWASVGNRRFDGGRQSTDEGEQAPGKANKQRARVPASAYKS